VQDLPGRQRKGKPLTTHLSDHFALMVEIGS
jgi:hypothetical protein